MSLPINRSAKTTLDTNLVNGNTSDAPAVKNSNDVVYNTIDELYNFALGLVTAGTLSQASQTPVANKIAQRDANGNVVNALPVSIGQNANLLFNPSAKLGLSGWTASNSGGSAWAANFGSGTEGGYYSVGSVTNAAPVLTSTKIPVAAGVTLTLSLEMLASGVTAGSQSADINFTDSAGVPVAGGSRVTATNGTGWAKYSVTMTVPTGAAFMQVRCFGDSGFTTTNSTWRKIKVEGGPVATTFSDDSTLNTNQYGSVLPLSQVLSGGNKNQNGVTGNLVPSVAGNQKMGTVTFPTAFGAPPELIKVGVYHMSIGTAILSMVRPENITATGFDIWASVQTTSTENVQYWWEATKS